MRKHYYRILACVIACVCAVAFMPGMDGQSYAAAKKPAKVTGVTLTKTKSSGDCTVKVKWTKVKKNVKKYQVKITNGKTKKNTFQKVSKKKRTTTFKAKAGITYTVRVRALNGTKKGKWSAAKRIKIKAPAEPESDPEPAPAALSEYWSADSAAAEQLRAYVAKVTNPKDAENYIPKRDRIAVFDMDGTLTCETYYTYYDTMMFI